MVSAVALQDHTGDARFQKLRDLVALTKPGVTRLVVFTFLAGLFLAPGHVDVMAALWSLLGCVLLVASANTLNCYLERDSDRLMTRTRTRPLPEGRLTSRSALLLGLALLAGAVPLLWLGGNVLTGALGLMAHLGYVLVYTPLKRHSAWSTVAGAIPGAMPPLMGWTAVTGKLDVAGVMLFLVLFVWQLPHTLAIGLFRKDEYAAAGIKVVALSVGDRRAQAQVFFTTVMLVPVTLSFYFLGVAGLIYLVGAGVLGGAFVLVAARGLRPEADLPWARRVFFFSMAYLALLMVVLGVDKAIGA